MKMKQKQMLKRKCQNCGITEAEIGDEFEELDYKGSGEWICRECADNLRADFDEVANEM
jgi:rubredoxin